MTKISLVKNNKNVSKTINLKKNIENIDNIVVKLINTYM